MGGGGGGCDCLAGTAFRWFGGGRLGLAYLCYIIALGLVFLQFFLHLDN